MEQPPRGSATTSAVAYLMAVEGDDGQRIDNYLVRQLKGVPRSLVYRILRTGEVRVNGRRAKPDYRIAVGDKIRVPPIKVQDKPEVKQPSKSLRDFIAAAVIYEDDELIVINKPAGVAVHGGSGLSFGVIEALRGVYPNLKELELVHRLDRETSGCLLVAKRRSVLRSLHAQLREREMHKIYRALVCGRWPLGVKRIELPLKTNLKQGGERVVKVHAQGQEAISTFTPIAHYGKVASLMSVSIGTGRTHQIRVHAAHAGYPIAFDEKYGDREKDAKLKPFGLQRMFLHAHSLEFARPGAQEPFQITAELPEELRAVIDRLEEAFPSTRRARSKQSEF